MKRSLVKVLILPIFISCCSLVHADEDIYKTRYTCFDLKGGERWQAEVDIKKSGREGVYLLTEKGEGIYTGFDGRIRWKSEMEFESDASGVRPLVCVRRIFDKDGNALAVQTQRFDLEDGKAVIIAEDLAKGTKKQKTFRFKNDPVNRLLLGLYIRKFLERGKRDARIDLFSNEPAHYKVDLRVIDTGKIEINGRQKETFRLCLDPDLGLFGIVKFVLPKAYVWHSTAPEYKWLRYKGLERGPGSPKVEIRTMEKT